MLPLAAWICLLPAAPGVEATVYVENATAAADLVALLREELPAGALVGAAAVGDLRARLSDALRLVIVDRAGITMVDRALEGGRDAAVRVAALLIVEAREAWRPAATAEVTVTATVPEGRAWRIGGAAGIGLSAWQTELTAQVVVPLSIYLAIGDFEVGVAGSIGGFVAVETDALRGVPRAYSIGAAGRWTFWSFLGAVETSIWAGVGYQRESVNARVIGGFAEPAQGPLQAVVFEGAIGRAGVGVGALIGWLRLRVDGGVQVQSQAGVTLPDEDDYRDVVGREIQRGSVVPWGVVWVGVEF